MKRKENVTGFLPGMVDGDLKDILSVYDEWSSKPWETGQMKVLQRKHSDTSYS